MTELYDKFWNKQYEKLVEFKRKHGNCLVPKKYPEDMSLGVWVAKQRATRVTNKLRLDRKELLDKIGFAWKAQGANNDKNWRQQYEKLVEFKRKNGHCMVPGKYKQDKGG